VPSKSPNSDEAAARQADALGEIAPSEILRGIVQEEQDHQIDLAMALGVTPDDRMRGETRGRSRSARA
jgi:hypothetical protein